MTSAIDRGAASRRSIARNRLSPSWQVRDGGFVWPISFSPTSTSSHPMLIRWRFATRSTGRRRRLGPCHSTIHIRCRLAISGRPRARSTPRPQLRPGWEPILRGTAAGSGRLGRPGQHSRRHGATWVGASRRYRSRCHHDAQYDPAGYPRGPRGPGSRLPHSGERGGRSNLQSGPGRTGHRSGHDAEGRSAIVARARTRLRC